jgi:hypothetical protein
MGTRAYRVGEPLQVGAEPIVDQVDQALEVLAPPSAIGVAQERGLGGEAEEPDPPVGALEVSPLRMGQIGLLRLEVGGAQMLAQHLPDPGGLRQPGDRAEEPNQRPVGVHGRVPVQAAVEGGMERSGQGQVLSGEHQMVGLVGELPGDTPEQQVRQSFRHRRVHVLASPPSGT